LAVQQAVVAALNADHAVSLVDAGADDGADRCIHARCVAAAGQYADGFDLSLHSGNPRNTHIPFPFYNHVPSDRAGFLPCPPGQWERRGRGPCRPRRITDIIAHFASFENRTPVLIHSHKCYFVATLPAPSSRSSS